MRKTAGIFVGLIVAAAMATVMAVPANAATTDTTTTVQVQAGDLSITAPTTLALSAANPGTTATGTLSGVEVSDLRAGVEGWTTSAAITDFSSATTSTSIPASAVGFTTADATTSGTVTLVASDATGGTGAVQTATDVTGNNTATWDQTVNVAVPSDAVAASDYTATLTYSVL